MRAQKYNHKAVEHSWQKRWREATVDETPIDTAQKPFYNLMMYPYPSAEGLHIGNMYAFTGSDIYGRFKRMQGFDVFEPIGLDGFGIHSENYAFKVRRHPMDHARITEENFYRQLVAIGCIFDWSRTLETYNSSYYHWTQWLFVQMFRHGLAYREKANVNWCPGCKTVLADEQVIAEKCERCGNIVEKRLLEQWFFRITAFAGKLLENLRTLDWSAKVKLAQQNWIGKKRGMVIKFPIKDPKGNSKSIEIFTSRPDTLWGTTFIALSIGWDEVPEITTADNQASVRNFIRKWGGKRAVDSTEKEGVRTGAFAINPVNNREIPIWVANYVVRDYGTGAVMGVPAHDARDYAFAQKYKIDIVRVISGDQLPYEGEGQITASGDWNTWLMPQDIVKVYRWLEDKKIGKQTDHYHLRDWLVSRQRYWGAPIPMVYCEACAASNKGEQLTMPGWYAVPEKDLPVILPRIEDYKPGDDGVAPLAKHREFFETKCPKCKGKAVRETDVFDTFLDSSWYFLRYPSVGSGSAETKPFDPTITKKWLPVSMYTGGAEHSVLHLMYSRFVTMALHDWGLLDFEEPFTRFYAHGLVIKDGAKMSKSKGNIVNPDEYIRLYGADAVRLYLMFMGPFDQGGNFQDTAMEGMSRWVSRVWSIATRSISQVTSEKPNIEIQKALHRLVKKVGEDIEKRRYNTAIAAMMEFTNFVADAKAILSLNDLGIFVKLLAPFAPYMCEELWQKLHPGTFNAQRSIHRQPWPTYDPKAIVEETVTVIVQVNGKHRDTLSVAAQMGQNKDDVEKLAHTSNKVQKYLTGGTVKKIVFVPGRLINYVIV